MRWIQTYNDKITSLEKAINSIQSGETVWIHPGSAEPYPLVQELVRQSERFTDVEIVHILTWGEAGYVKPGMEKHFHHTALFTGPNVREAVNEGRADFVPIFLSEVSNLFLSGAIKVDNALVHLSPPDEHGFCSFGVGVDNTMAVTRKAKKIIALVNNNMPRVHGDNFIHVSRLTHVVEMDVPLKELARPKMSDTHKKIGEFVASLIKDGDTLQMGIGGIPDAVLDALHDKNDLGIHSEMFSDGVVELAEMGIINGSRKTLHPGKIVAGFVLGSKYLFEYVDDNPIVEFHPVEYTNDPFIIAQNDNMIAINSALEIDITGQVCADSMGTAVYSGIGGQLDFIRGAARSKGGKPIIALPSTAKNGKLSRIVPRLQPGASVTTTRGDVHYIVTEFGVAYLHGKSLSRRAEALIQIAHPDFRDELKAEARKRKLL